MDEMAVKRRKAKAERKDSEVRIRVTPAEKEAWTLASKKEGRDLSNWLRWIARRASGMSEDA
jgi:hypothetical protein